jgi:hypothetical protein
MKLNEIIESYREKFKAEIDLLLKLNGNNFEESEFILENALDLALNDKRNEIYK